MNLKDIIDEIISKPRASKCQKDGFSVMRFLCWDDLSEEISDKKEYTVIASNKDQEIMTAFTYSFDDACDTLKNKWNINSNDNLDTTAFNRFAILHKGKLVR